MADICRAVAQTGGESVMEVDSVYRDGGEYVVCGSGDDDGGIWQR